MLNEMIKVQQQRVSEQQCVLPFSELLRNTTRSDRDFYGALHKKSAAYILECKQRSPSEGKLCEHYPVAELAKHYEPFADVISVLTNEQFFAGSFHHLHQVREQVNVPVLCKDIIVSPYQVAKARYHGADAILLMLSVLTDDDYLACKEIAEKFNMGILTEVVTVDELMRAKALQAKVIAINHRDLNTLQIDMERTIHLSTHFPIDAIIIAASGIKSAQTVARIAPYVNGFLIGSVLSQSKDLAVTLRELVYGQIKICGLTRQEDSMDAFQHGASYGGLIFVPTSPRCITLEHAQRVISGAPLRYVGVFAQQPISTLVHYTKILNLHAVQLHGHESHEYIMELRQALPNTCQIWLAISGNNDLPSSLPSAIDKLIVDNMVGKQLGGRGRAFSWENVRYYGLRQHCLLAGGIHQENIHDALQTGFAGLDINSGVEQHPGIKSAQKIQMLLQTIRENAACIGQC